MALDPIQQSPYTSYPYFQKDYNTAASFSQGFQDSQKEAMNRIAMDTAQQQQITADQAMRLKDLEEARKQILFKRQQGEWGRADAMAKTGIPGSSFTVSPYGGGSSIVGGENRLVPPVPGAGVTPAAPAAAAPGPQSSVYEPSSEKPSWYNPQNVAGLRGVQVAQNTTTMNDASPSGSQLYGALGQFLHGSSTNPRIAASSVVPMVTVDGKPYTGPVPTPTSGRPQWDSARGGVYTSDGRPSMGQELINAYEGNPNGVYEPINVGGRQALVGVNPYGEVNPSASKFVQHVQGGMSALNANAALNYIDRRLGGGYMASAYPVSNYFIGSPANSAAREVQATMRDWYSRPEIRSLLLANPQLLYAAEKDPVAFYKENAVSKQSDQPVVDAASTTPAQPQAGLRTQADAAAAAEEPINVGTQRRALIGDQQYLTLTERVAKGEDIPNFIYDANNTIPLQQHQRELQGLQIQYKRAQLGRNVAAMTEIENRVRAIQNDVSLLHGIQAINEMRAGSPENLARALYNVTGGRATIQQAANGTFNVYEGNKLVRQNVAPETLGNWSKAVFDTNFKTQVAQLREAKAAQDKQIFDAHIKGLEETLKQQAIGSKEGALKAIEFDLKRTYPDYEVKPDPEGKGVWVVNKSNPNDSRFIKLEEQIINGKKQFLPKVY